MQNLDLKNKTVFITGVAGFIGSNLAERLLKEIEGMLMKAAEDFNVDLGKSWMIGDGENDVLAGKNAGCKTVLIGNQDYQQDYTVSSLKEFVDRVL